MVRKLIFLSLFALLLIQSVMPLDTGFNIETMPNHRISLIVREMGKLTTLESFHQETGTGDLTIKTSVAVDYIDIVLTLKKDGQNIINDKFESLQTGKNYVIYFLPGTVEIRDELEISTQTNLTETNSTDNVVSNESLNETNATIAEAIETETSLTEEVAKNTEINEQEDVENNTSNNATEKQEKTEKERKSIAGFSLLNESVEKISITAIIIIVVIVLILIFLLKFLFMGSKKGDGFNTSFKITPLSEFRKSKDHIGDRIEDIERKLDEIRKDIEEIKQKERKINSLKETISKL